MFPHELTFGVFDAAMYRTVEPMACLWIKEIPRRRPNGSINYMFMDGGTLLESNNDSLSRYCLQGMVKTPGTLYKMGDVVRLIDYRIERTKQGEPVLVINQMEQVRHTEGEPLQTPTLRYPYQTAKSELDKLKEESTHAPYRPENQQLLQTLHPTASHTSASVNYSTMDNHTERPHATKPLSTYPPMHEMEITGKQQQLKNNHQSNLYPTLPTQLSMRINYNPYGAPQGSNQNPYDEDASSVTNTNPFSRQPNLYDDGSVTNSNLYPGHQQLQTFSTPNQTSESYRPVRRGDYDSSSGGGFSGNAQRAAPYPPQYRASGPVAHRTDGQYVPIKDLTAFLGRWIVKGRFVNVGVPRPYTNAKGEGKIWNMDLVDSQDACGVIRCTMFNKVVDKFQPIIKENEVYTVSKGSIKPANKKFNSGAHDYEVTLNEDSEIQWVSSDDPTIPIKHTTRITPINQLADLVKNTSASVCGILIKCRDIMEVTTRSTGRPLDKRDITLVDESGTTVDVTLWGDRAHTMDAQLASTMPVLLLEGAKVDEYNGRKLSYGTQTSITVNPDTPEAKRLRQWFETEGRMRLNTFSSLTTSGWSDRQAGEAVQLTIAQIKHRATSVISESELEDKGAWFTCRATLNKIYRDKQWHWVACPTCGRKVSFRNGANDGFSLEEATAPFCTVCQKDVDQPTKKFLLSLQIADRTGSLSCTAMGDKGVLLMGGVSADSLVQWSTDVRQGQEEKRFSNYFSDREGRLYLFKLQAKMERYRDEAIIKYRVFGADPISGDDLDLPLVGSTQATTIAHLINEPAMALMRSMILKDALASIQWIYEFIPRVRRT